MIATWLWSAFSIARGSWITKYASIALVGIAAYWGHNTFIKNQARKALIAESKKEGKKKNEKSKVIRKNASKPGAAARLLKSDCRDCN